MAINRKENLTICDNMDGPRGYYAQWSMSGREKQMPYYFTYMWNLKNEINGQTKEKQTDT